MTHIADLLDGEVGVSGDTGVTPTSAGSHIHNYHHWPRAEPLEQLRDLQVG